MRSFACIAMLLVAVSAQAKPISVGRGELIATADLIAVVDIVELEPYGDRLSGGCDGRSPPMTPRAHVVEVLRGHADRVFLFKAPCEPCSSPSLQNGRYLVFLSTRGRLPMGLYGHFSYRPVTGNTVQWLPPEPNEPWMQPPLPEVVREIRAYVKRIEAAADMPSDTAH
jgi:hypothetical protein